MDEVYNLPEQWRIDDRFDKFLKPARLAG